MASRMIHYTVSELIADRMDFSDKNRFLVGSLAPDMAGYEHDRHKEGIHRSAHFMEEYRESGLRGINWLRFYNEYLKDDADDEFALGYFAHLICDAIWLADIQAKYIYAAAREERERAVVNGYEDMRRCNYHIAEKYRIRYDIRPLRSFTVDEADISYQMNLLADLKLDFLPYGNGLKLKIHNWDAITGYIDKCVRICLKEIGLVKGGGEPDSPLGYMIPMGL